MAKVITVTVPNDPVQVLTIAVPQVGPAGPAALLTMGTVNTLTPGVNGTATITGTAPNYVLNLGLPVGVYSRATVAVTASRTLALTDAGKTIDANHATVPIVLTIPLNSAVAFPIGTLIGVNWDGVAAVTLAATGGVTTTGGGLGTTPAQLSPRARYSAVNLRKTGTDSWHVEGDFLEATDATVNAATTNATAGTLALRDGSGNATFGSVFSSATQSTAITAVTRKDYVDAADTALSGRITPLETANTAATSSATNNTLALRSGTGTASFTDVVSTGASPAGTSSLTRKDYVDGQDAAFRRTVPLAITANRTFSLTDESLAIYTNTASNLVLTVPLNSVVAFPIGGWIDVIRWGTGTVTIAPTAGVTLGAENGSFDIRAQYGRLRLVKISTDSWSIVGDGSTANDIVLSAATDAATANALVRREGSGNATFNTVFSSGTQNTGVTALTRKDYVDTQDLTIRRTAPLAVSASRTLALTDEGAALYSNVTSAVVVTVPLNSAVAFPVGAWIDVIRFNTGTVTIAPAAGVTLGAENNSYDIRAIYGKLRLTKLTTDTWSVEGDGTTVTDAAVTAAIDTATVSTIMKRDSAGRAKVIDPAVAADIATKNYVDNQTLTLGRSVSVSTTLALTDAQNFVASTAAGGITFTVPLNSAVAFPIGSRVAVAQLAAGTITIAAAAGVTLNSAGATPLTTKAQNAWVNLVKTATDTWVVSGDLTPPSYACMAYQSTGSQSIPNAAFTVVNFEGELTDTAAMHSTSTNTARITIVSAGTYVVSGTVGFAVNGTGNRLALLQKNGVDIAGTAGSVPANSVVFGIATSATAVIPCVVGDYFTLTAYQNSGVALSTTAGGGQGTSLSVFKVN